VTTVQPSLWDLPEGRRLRDEGMARAGEAEDRAGRWREAALRWVEVLAAGEDFTAEDVREAVGDPVRPNAMGAVFNTARRHGLIVLVGLTTARRSPRHASRLPVWRRL